MAAYIFSQKPNYSPLLTKDKTPQQKYNLNHFSPSKNTSKRHVISSSTMSPYSPITSLSQLAPEETLLLSNVWREIQGSNNWENLIDPLNPILQQEIIRYGNLVSASYKGFDLNPNSKRYLNCKYGKKTLLKESKIHDFDSYKVTKYIYATPDIIKPNLAHWIGYVAVSSDESMKRLGRRDIVVTFRGTVTNHEWLANLMSSLTPAKLDPCNHRLDVKVESGFLSLYTSNEKDRKFGLESCREQLLSEIWKLMKKYKDEEMSITLAGHSMGSSLAHLLGYDIAELGMNKRSRNQKDVPVTVFSFGGPRVGNLGFKKRCDELGVRVLRITNVKDPITKLPWSCFSYTHVGVELKLDFFDVQKIHCVHDLDTYISLVNSPRILEPVVKEDNLKIMLCKGRYCRVLRLRKAVTKVAYILSFVSNHMLYYSIFLSILD